MHVNVTNFAIVLILSETMPVNTERLMRVGWRTAPGSTTPFLKA
jgi:hypothetical protein